jgi:hypothetical protein
MEQDDFENGWHDPDLELARLEERADRLIKNEGAFAAGMEDGCPES